MKQVSYVDVAVRTCPCGESFSWSDCAPVALDFWTRRHEPHTNGKLKHSVGHDWHKVYGSRPKDYTTDL